MRGRYNHRMATHEDQTPQVSSAALRSAVEEALPLLLRADESRTIEPSRPGGWCAREVLGHLIDSACNNHRRFIAGQSPDTVQFDAYEQDAWVSRQQYRDVPWSELVALWCAYNRHLAHVMNVTSPETARAGATAPDGSGTLTIAFLMTDYVRHLRHHLGQIRALLTTRDSTPTPQ